MKSQNNKEQKSDFSYKETLNLLKTDFSMRANSVVREPEIQNFWSKNNIDFQLGSSNSGEIFTLHDGPPYANGDLHMGHALNKVLKDLINELLGIELDKSSQSSDWGSNEDLTKDQLEYAANDVRYLIEAMHKLKVILERENRYELAQKCFKPDPVHADLDILKFSNIFEH